jgi:hypothetical protein
LDSESSESKIQNIPKKLLNLTTSNEKKHPCCASLFQMLAIERSLARFDTVTRKTSALAVSSTVCYVVTIEISVGLQRPDVG